MFKYVVRGVMGAWYFTEYPEICSLPYICNFIVYNIPDKILNFLKNNETARGYAESSEKAFAFILSNLSKFIGILMPIEMPVIFFRWMTFCITFWKRIILNLYMY